MSRQFLLVATWVLLVIASCEIGFTQPDSPAQTGSSRQPVPSADALMQAVRSLQVLYGSDYARAAKSGGKLVLAKKLLEAAANTQNEPVSKYAALVEARRLAQEVGDVATTFKSIELLTAEYDLATPFTEKTVAIVLLGNVGSTTSTLRELAKELLPTLEEAVAADDFHSAKKIHSVAVEVARKRGDKSLSTRLDRTKLELDGLELQFTEYAEAKQKLDKDPRDTSAHRTIGLYLGLRKDRWEEGEQHIHLAQDEMLHSLFARQCSPPTAVADQGALGDAWWDWAYLQKGISKVQARALAGSWYRACQSDLAGLAKARADERLKSLNPSLNVRQVAVPVAVPVAATSEPAGDVARQTPKSESLLSRDRLAFAKGPWTLRDDQLTYGDPARKGITRIKGGAPGDFRMEIEATPSEVTPATLITLGFQRANREFAIQLTENGSCVLAGDDGLQPQGPPKNVPVWHPARPNVISYDVHGDTLTVKVNGEEFLAYKADELKNAAASNFSLTAIGLWKFSKFDFYPNQ